MGEYTVQVEHCNRQHTWDEEAPWEVVESMQVSGESANEVGAEIARSRAPKDPNSWCVRVWEGANADTSVTETAYYSIGESSTGEDEVFIDGERRFPAAGGGQSLRKEHPST